MEEPIWQKRVPKKVPDWLQTATVAFPSGRTAEELVANDAAHLVWAVNLGVIDFNPWPVRRAALALAREVERRAPDLATSKWWKEERHGVFVDYNQNARDRTVASCYSVRPTVDARVSCALRWEEVADAEPGDLRLDTVLERLRTVGDPAADIDAAPGSLDGLLELARRDEEEGLGDAPWPPHFPKARGEPKRVQPSRDRDRPTHRGRAGDPQPGGPPPGVPGGLQRGFGSKPRTGQGHEYEFDED